MHEEPYVSAEAEDRNPIALFRSVDRSNKTERIREE